MDGHHRRILRAAPDFVCNRLMMPKVGIDQFVQERNGRSAQWHRSVNRVAHDQVPYRIRVWLKAPGLSPC